MTDIVEATTVDVDLSRHPEPTARHYYCRVCHPSPTIGSVALCGFVKPTMKPATTGFTDDDCVVCRDLWRSVYPGEHEHLTGGRR